MRKWRGGKRIYKYFSKTKDLINTNLIEKPSRQLTCGGWWGKWIWQQNSAVDVWDDVLSFYEFTSKQVDRGEVTGSSPVVSTDIIRAIENLIFQSLFFYRAALKTFVYLCVRIATNGFNQITSPQDK
jgi:hypothetical protein